ncbi:MAG: DUF418 domain-containing protein [Candidatus Rokubacteria bacterium]|nr:DUF418 domain-containing protein [Candidatus Rokubacteria bacterium]
MEPIPPRERIDLLDVLRGGAVFGILLVNMAYFSMPIYLADTDVLRWWTGGADRAAVRVIRLLFEGKFYLLFSFLFGVGMAMQMARARPAGARFVALWTRRMLLLLVFGAAHALLLSAIDVLALYALLGLVLLVARAASDRKLLLGTVLCFGLAFLANDEWLTLAELAFDPGAAERIREEEAASEARYAALTEQAIHAYAEGGLGEIVAQRVRDLGFYYVGVVAWGPTVLGMFFVGLSVGRRGVLGDVSAWEPILRRVMWCGLGVGLAGNLVAVVTREASSADWRSVIEPVKAVAFGIGAPALSAFYVAATGLLLRRPAWRRRLAPLAAVGRMALSNYLLQSLVCTTIFYSYGLGLYGRVGPAAGAGLSAVVFAAEVAASVWWLGRFRFGPMEWLWRSLTYGRWFAMREKACLNPTSA